MRVLQLIDSLRPGGAEKMAVNIANALVPHVEKSYLCCTIIEGSLKNNLHSDVLYFFLKKRGRFDIKALLKLQKLIKENKIDIVHAHGTSFFFPSLLKFGAIKFNLIWHIHNGGTPQSSMLNQKIISYCSQKFNGIIAVNAELKKWAINYLGFNQVIECKNFIGHREIVEKSAFKFEGEKGSFRIVCLANLRPEKGHIYLLEAFENIKVNIPCSLHLIGALPENFKSTIIFKKYDNSSVKDKIYFYGIKENVPQILAGVHLGVLASDYEGLPMALLEYGFAGLPVIVTDVGFCREVVEENGLLVPPKNPAALTEALDYYINDRGRREKDAAALQRNILKNYSENAAFPYILAFYKHL